MKQETQHNSSRTPRNETKKRCCSVCGKMGHNARTCQVVISLSEDDNEQCFQLILGVEVDFLTRTFT